MLQYGVEVGFYSQVELLLRIGQWSQNDLGNALEQAAYDERVDLLNLLLDSGAPWESVCLSHIFGTMNDDLIQRFLDLGIRFDDDDAYYYAMEHKHARPLLRIYKQYRDKYPELEDQVAKSLVSSVREEKAHWTIMLLWAGADPMRPVPDSLTGRIEEDDYTTNAIREALLRGNQSFLETTKITSKIKDYQAAFKDALFNYDPKILEPILKHLTSEQINYSEHNSCENLEHIIRHEYWDFRWSSNKEKEQEDMLACIRLLIDSGARWDPPDDYLRSARKGLCSYDGRYAVQVIRLLVYTPGTATFEKTWSLCNTAKMKHTIYSADDYLWRELNEMALERGLKGATKRSSRRVAR